DSVKSTRFVGGPKTTPRPELPGTFVMPELTVGLRAKQAVLNHCCCVCAPPLFGSQSKVGRFPEISAGELPSPAASHEDVVTVNGRPVWNVPIPDACQPPRTLPTKPF